MAQDLQHLIDRIQEDAVGKAEQQAEEILQQARRQAEKRLAEARDEAAAILARAETDAQQFQQRAETSLEQAARDLLLTVGTGVERIFSEILARSVGETLDADTLEKLLLNLARLQCEGGVTEEVALLVSEEDKERLRHFAAHALKEKLGSELEVQADSEILKGCRILFKQEKVFVDFTHESIAASLEALLRPELAALVSRVAGGRKDD